MVGRCRGTAQTQTIALPTPPPLGAKVSAAQSLCGPQDSSPPDAPGQVSEKAHLVLTKQPDGPITRGVPTAFRFHCRDQDTSDKDRSEWMFISLNGRLGQCGSVIAVTIFNDDPRSSIVATLPDTCRRPSRCPPASRCLSCRSRGRPSSQTPRARR
jgi:hypothetical protein